MVWGMDMLNRLRMPGMWMLLAGLMYTTAYAQPVVNLGPDVFACGSAVLNAGNAGASFLWSTGESTQTITVTTSGIYWVDVTNGSGTTRDSINATITSTPATPAVVDTSVCGGIPFTISGGSAANKVVWYDAPTGGNIRGIGPSISLNLNSSLTLYPQAVNHLPIVKVGAFTFPSLLYTNQTRGLTFDVFSPITIHSVVLYSNTPTDVTIYVVNAANQTIASTRVQIPGVINQAARVPLMFDVPTGNNYRLMGLIHSGRLSLPASGVTYPYVSPGLASIKSADNGNLGNYNYFFDWEISRSACRSPRAVKNVTVLPSPVVNLGLDRLVCGLSGETLSAFNAGATYLWSNGSTDSAIVVNTDGVYSVTADLGGCIDQDTVSLLFLPEATNPVVNDTAVCGGVPFVATAGSQATRVLWYDAPTGGKILGTSPSLTLNLSDTTTLYPQALNHATVSRVGMVTFPNLLYTNQTRGLLFNVLGNMTLQSVVLYSNTPTDVTIFVQNAANQTIASTRVQIPGVVNQPARVPLFFDIPVGLDYRLMATVHSGQLSLPGSGATFPYTLAGLVSIRSANDGNLGNYNYFFDWEVSRAGCRSSRVPVTFNTLPSPVVNLGPDRLVCGLTGETLSAFNAGATYVWSTGSIDPSIIVNTDGVYSVTANMSGCVDQDTVSLVFLPEAANPVANDTAVCGGVPFVASVGSPATRVLWYDAPTGGKILGTSASLTLSLSDTTTLYPQALNHSTVSQVGQVTFPSLLYTNQTRGLLFDAFSEMTLQSVVLYANGPTDVTIFVQNAASQTITSTRVQVAGVLNQAVRVPLFFDVPAGLNYRLMATVHSGQLSLPSSGATFPYTITGLVSIKSANDGNLGNYNYFFNWEVSRTGCRSSRVPVTFNTLPSPVVNLGPDRLVCGLTGETLSAFNASATYVWSTGSTDSAIVVNTDGVYSVTANMSGCVDQDTVSLVFLPEAANPVANDTAVCGGVPFVASVGSPATRVLWYDAPTGGKILGTSASLTLSLSDTTTLYPQALNHSTVSQVGQVTFPSLLYTNQTRGLLFDAFSEMTLQSVVLYANGPTDVTIFVQNAASQTIASTRVQVAGVLNQAVRVPLFFDVPAGLNYRLMATVHSGQLSLPSSGATFPYTITGLVSIKSANDGNLGNYNYFFNWEVSRTGCRSSRVPVTFNTLPSPVVNLGPDRLICGNTAQVLDATNPSATYTWSTGATTPTLSVTADGVYSVLADISGCTDLDTVEVTFIPEALTPERTDTTVCANIPFVLATTGTTDEVLWVNPATQKPVFTGSSVSLSVTDTTEYVVFGVNHLAASQVGVSTFPGLLYTNSLRGLRFDVFRPMTLHSVVLYANQPTDVTIFVQNASGQTIASNRVQIPGVVNQPARVPLFFDIPAGVNYQLMGQIHSGQLALPASGVTFPYVVPNLVSIKTSHDGNMGNFNYFLDWKVSRTVCYSAPDTVRVNALPTPVANLGRDTVICGTGPYVVNVAQPGASYFWSDSSTLDNFVFLNSDTVGVEISLGICVARDTIAVEFLPEPDVPVSADTLFCGGEGVTLTASTQEGTLVWFGSAAGPDVLGTGPVLTLNVPDSTTLYVESVTSSQSFTTGRTNPGTLLYTNTTRGIRFDAFTDLNLKNVTVFTQVPTRARIFLQNASGQTLYSVVKEIDGVNGAATVLDLYFDVPQGNNYRLMAEVLSGSLSLPSNAAGYPFILPGIISLKSDDLGGLSNYNYFFRWTVTKAICHSPRVPVKVDIKYPISFNPTYYSCAPFQVAASSNAGGTYLWSTGQTTNAIQIDSSGTYSVVITDATGCEVRDTLEAEIPMTAGLQEDGILCGNTLITNYGTDAIHLWNTGDTTATLTINAPGTYSVRVLEPRGCDLRDTITVTGFDTFPVVNLGDDIIACDSVILNAGNPGLSYLWSTGQTTQTVVLQASGTYFVEVTNANNCATLDTVGVFVTPSPEADFFVEDTVISPNLSVFFINQSSFGLFFWSFGDGSTSTSFNPTHTYGAQGTYCVKLIVTDVNNDCGNDTIEKCFTLLRNPVGLDPVLAANWKVYPVPADEVLHVSWPEGQEVSAEATLWTLGGERLESAPLVMGEAQFAVANYPAGRYVLVLRREGVLVGRKLVELR